MPILGAALDFAKLEGRNLRAHQLGAAPSSPVTGQVYFNTGDNTLYWYDGSAWVSARGGASATPPATTGALGTIQLAGDLAGTATSPQIAAGAVTDADVNAANKDGVAGTASMRTLGTGAQQAAAGNDSRFTNARTPTAHATTHQPGGSDPMAVDQAAATASLRSLGLTATQAMPGNTTLNAIAAPNGAVSLGNQAIQNLQPPTFSADAATKGYVDQTTQGLDAKQSVRAASTGNLTLSGNQTVDGIALVNLDRVLVKDQTTASQNGIYVVAAGAWQRAIDMDAWAEVPSAYTFVELGTTQADTGWVCTADQGGIMDSTAMPWVQFSGAGQIVAGGGLTKTGNTLDVGAGAGITVNADTIQVANTGITAAMMAAASVAIGTSVVTGTLQIANGGTAATTPAVARQNLIAAGYYNNNATHGAGTTITITAAAHGLRATRGIIVQVCDNTTGAVELPDVVIAANGDVTVTYAASVAANSKMIALTG